MTDRAVPSRSESALLGEWVQVTLTDANDTERVVVEGRLLAFGDCGDFVIEDAGGFLHFAWPMLHVERLSDERLRELRIPHGPENEEAPMTSA